MRTRRRTIDPRWLKKKRGIITLPDVCHVQFKSQTLNSYPNFCLHTTVLIDLASRRSFFMQDILYHIHVFMPMRYAAQAACVSHAFLRSQAHLGHLHARIIGGRLPIVV